MRSFQAILRVAAPAAAITVFIGASRPSPPPPFRQGAPALATKFDTIGDTIFARVPGTTPPARILRLTQELSIAPGIDDTTLFTRVSDFTVDGAGRFWVFDQPSASFFIFGRDGKLVKKVGRKGGGPGEFESNNGAVILPGDKLAMWDARNGRITYVAQDGSFERSTLLSKGFYTFRGLVTDKSGSLYTKRMLKAGSFASMGLIRLRADGTDADSIAPPDVHVTAPSWTVSSGSGTATYSSRNAASASWYWHPDAYFVTIDGLRSRIILSRRGAKPIVVERRLPPVSISADEQADDRAAITFGLRQTQRDWKWTGASVPESKPALGAGMIGRDGRIWVRVATPSQRIPDSELPEQRPNASPPYRFRSPIEWEVFAANGTWLGRVAFPKDAQLMEADGNTVWALGKDDDDLPALKRFRIDPGLPAR